MESRRVTRSRANAQSALEYSRSFRSFEKKQERATNRAALQQKRRQIAEDVKGDSHVDQENHIPTNVTASAPAPSDDASQQKMTRRELLELWRDEKRKQAHARNNKPPPVSFSSGFSSHRLGSKGSFSSSNGENDGDQFSAATRRFSLAIGKGSGLGGKFSGRGSNAHFYARKDEGRRHTMLPGGLGKGKENAVVGMGKEKTEKGSAPAPFSLPPSKPQPFTSVSANTLTKFTPQPSTNITVGYTMAPPTPRGTEAALLLLQFAGAAAARIPSAWNGLEEVPACTESKGPMQPQNKDTPAPCTNVQTPETQPSASVGASEITATAKESVERSENETESVPSVPGTTVVRDSPAAENVVVEEEKHGEKSAEEGKGGGKAMVGVEGKSDAPSVIFKNEEGLSVSKTMGEVEVSEAIDRENGENGKKDTGVVADVAAASTGVEGKTVMEIEGSKKTEETTKNEENKCSQEEKTDMGATIEGKEEGEEGRKVEKNGEKGGEKEGAGEGEGVSAGVVVKDGEYWRGVMLKAKAELEGMCAKWKGMLDSPDSPIPESVSGTVMAVCGQSHLLVDKRFAQYSELCDISKDENAELSARSSDLEGFWDVIDIQVEDVRNKFGKLEELMANGWKEKKVVPVRKPVAKPAAAAAGGSKGAAGPSEAEKKRQEARQRLMEAKKAARDRAKQGTAQVDEPTKPTTAEPHPEQKPKADPAPIKPLETKPIVPEPITAQDAQPFKVASSAAVAPVTAGPVGMSEPKPFFVPGTTTSGFSFAGNFINSQSIADPSTGFGVAPKPTVSANVPYSTGLFKLPSIPVATTLPAVPQPPLPIAQPSAREDDFFMKYLCPDSGRKPGPPSAAKPLRAPMRLANPVATEDNFFSAKIDDSLLEHARRKEGRPKTLGPSAKKKPTNTQAGEEGERLGSTKKFSLITPSKAMRDLLGTEVVMSPVRRSSRLEPKVQVQQKLTFDTVKDVPEDLEFGYAPNKAITNKDDLIFF
eukprot:comp23922_c0_seq1/m.42217 comp23922_c0_seq1/g.42217  ORF comp23922_c0_seq1/g.42217 comp23922_c0_seq1/m.42217 type:complete len:989 (-) comp23922_c0_seq1:23-2989(-)